MAASTSNEQDSIQFIEMLGRTLLDVLTDCEPSPSDLAQVGLTNQSLVRVNRQGDVEIRRTNCWEVIGGLLGDFETRIKQKTGLDWA